MKRRVKALKRPKAEVRQQSLHWLHHSKRLKLWWSMTCGHRRFFLIRMPWSQWPLWPMFSDALGFAHYVPDTRYFFFKAGIFRLEHGKTFARATPRDTTQKLSKCQLPPYNYTKKFSLLQPLLQPGGRVILYCVDKAFSNHEQAIYQTIPWISWSLRICITVYITD